MHAVLIPVKNFAQAKRRLTGLLAQEERMALARAMLEDVFRAVAASRGGHAVFVISSDAMVLARARYLGWETIPEEKQVSESHSVDLAARWCEARGVHSLLRLPVDIPLVEPRDIEAVLRMKTEARSAVLVPSRDGTGTNALRRNPPALFSSHFGPGSLAKHLEHARLAGARAQVIRNPRIELDIDDEADLRAFLATGGKGTETAACLGRLSVARRLGTPDFSTRDGTLLARQ
jgi:2-phospho-L-lactate guanylyltransferase